MANNRMSGNLLGLEINGVFISCEISCDFSFEAEMRPASPITSGRWSSSVPGIRSWSINLNASMLLMMLDGASLPVVLNAFFTGALLGVRFMVKNPAIPNFRLYGNAFVQSGAISGTVNVLAGWNVTLKGDGPFEAEINTNVVYVLSTNDTTKDKLVQDGGLNLIVAAPGTGKDVTVGYVIEKGNNPLTGVVFGLVKNGVDLGVFFSGSGFIPDGTFKSGDTMQAYQVAYPQQRWAPGSNANFNIKVDGVTVLNNNTSNQDPVVLYEFGPYVIPAGVSVIAIRCIGSNDSLNYYTRNLQTTNNIGADLLKVNVSDNLEAGLGLVNQLAAAGTTGYPFNVKDTIGTMTVILENLKVTDITYNLAGEGGYLQTGTIPGGGSVTHADVTKGSISTIVSDI